MRTHNRNRKLGNLRIFLFQKNENVANRKFRNLGNFSEISDILFRVFSFPGFRDCLEAKIENSDFKKIAKKISEIFEISEVLTFPVPTKLPQLEIR